jgi:hypothetical protein
MDNLATSTILQVVGGLFTVVLLPLLYLYLKRRIFDGARTKLEPEPPRPQPPGPVKALQLTGRWVDDCGHIFDFVAHLNAVQAQIKGHFDWTLVEGPPSSPSTKRVGQSGSEFVEGFLDGRQLVLHGYQVDKPKLLGLGDYAVVLSEDNSSFEGTSRDKNGVAGRLRGAACVLG